MTDTLEPRGSATVSAPRWAGPTSLGLALLGLLVSAYLTVEHYTSSTSLACPETSTLNCVKVTTSSYASLFGVPVALLGLLFFVAMVLLGLPAAWRATSPWVHRARLAGVVGGALFVLYLVWVELFRVDAICLWCSVVHVVTVALFAVVALASALREP